VSGLLNQFEAEVKIGYNNYQKLGGKGRAWIRRKALGQGGRPEKG